jgi:hypothetical protein
VNRKFSVKFNAAASGSATLNISSDGVARSLKKPGGADFKPKAGTYTFIRDGENFQLLGEGGEYGTATQADAREGTTIGTENGVVPGTAADNGPATAETISLTMQNQEYTIVTGFHSGLRKIKAAITGLVADVIKYGSNAGGIDGNYTGDATATDADVLVNKIYYRKGVKGIGGMPYNGDQSGILNITGAARPYVDLPAGCISASRIYAQLDASLASKIIENNTIGNVTGTAKPKDNVSVGDTVIATSDADVMSNNYGPKAKVKEIQIHYDGAVRVSFEMNNSNLRAQVRIADVNDNVITYGTERISGSNTGTYTTYTEDFAINPEDKIQLWLEGTSGAQAYAVRNFRVKINNHILATVNL